MGKIHHLRAHNSSLNGIQEISRTIIKIVWELVTSGFPIRSTNTLGVCQDPTHTAALSSQMIHYCL